MSGTTADPRMIGARAAPKKALRLSWSDPRFRAIVWQIVIVGVVALVVWYLIGNTNRNLAARHIATGFGFLGRIAGIPIGESLIPYNPAVDTYGRALIIGILNTLKVAVVGVVLATILGTLVGIGRLSQQLADGDGDRVLRRDAARHPAAAAIVVLVHDCCRACRRRARRCTSAARCSCPTAASELPTLDLGTRHTWALLAFLAGAVGHLAVEPPRAPAAGGDRAAAGGLAGRPAAADCPAAGGLGRARRADRDRTCRCCTASISRAAARSARNSSRCCSAWCSTPPAYIAEIVRSGIQAVALGQWEAAGALGLSRGAVLRRIVLPQALRVIMPPMTSQYLNLTKNSSLAVAIGYQDVVSIANTTLNQTGQAIEGIAVIMAVYLTISLSISLFMNWYNAHIALVER